MLSVDPVLSFLGLSDIYLHFYSVELGVPLWTEEASSTRENDRMRVSDGAGWESLLFTEAFWHSSTSTLKVQPIHSCHPSLRWWGFKEYYLDSLKLSVCSSSSFPCLWHYCVKTLKWLPHTLSWGMWLSASTWGDRKGHLQGFIHCPCPLAFECLLMLKTNWKTPLTP